MITIQAQARKNIPLLLILGLALAFRLAYPTGVVFDTDFSHARLAADFAEKIQPFFDLNSWKNGDLSTAWQSLINVIHQNGAGQFLAFLPVSLSYALFGINDVSSLLYPLICSLSGLLLFYGIVRFIAGQQTAYLAAFLWSVFPSEIYYATVMSTVAPFFMLNMAFLYFFLLSGRVHQGRGMWMAWFAAGISLLLACFILPAGWLNLLVFIAIILFQPELHPAASEWLNHRLEPFKISNTQKTIGFIFLLFILWLFTVHFTTGFSKLLKNILQILFTPYEGITREKTWYIYLPLLAAGLILLGLRKNQYLKLPAIWLASIYPFISLYLAGGEGIEKFILLLYVPIILISAIYFSIFSSGENSKGFHWMICGCILFNMLVLWLGKQAQPVLIDLSPTFWRLVFLASILAGGISWIACIASPLLLHHDNEKIKLLLIGILLCLFSLSMHHPVKDVYSDVNHSTQSSQKIYHYLFQQKNILPVYCEDQYILERLDYLSGYQWGNPDRDDILQNPLQLMPENPNMVDEGYLVTTRITTEEGWLPLQQFMQPGYTIYWLYRITTPEEAQAALEKANEAVQRPDSGGKEYFELYQASLSAGLTCQGYYAWMSAIHNGYPAQPFLPVNEDWRTCFEQDSDDLFGEKKWERSGFSFGVFSQQTDANNSLVNIYQKTKYSDKKTLFQQISLQNETFYLFETTLRNDGEQTVYTPYWYFNENEFTVESGVYPDWHYSGVLFYLPENGKLETDVLLTPFLFNGPQTAYFKDTRLVKISSSWLP